MKKIYLAPLLATASLALGLQLTSCTEKPAPFIGAWQSIAPLNLDFKMQEYDNILANVSLDFKDSQQDTDGPVSLKCSYDAVRMPDTSAPAGSAKTTFSADASVKGTWSYDVDDHDDLLIVFDYSSIDVTIDKSSISNPSFANFTPAQIDSVAAVYTSEIKTSFREGIMRLSAIEDVDVSKDGKILSFEVEDPDQDFKFKRL